MNRLYTKINKHIKWSLHYFFQQANFVFDLIKFFTLYTETTKDQKNHTFFVYCTKIKKQQDYLNCVDDIDVESKWMSKKIVNISQGQSKSRDQAVNAKQEIYGDWGPKVIPIYLGSLCMGGSGDRPTIPPRLGVPSCMTVCR